MNTPLQAMDPSAANGAFASLGSAVQHKLPRQGGRPIIFDGTELAMAMSYTPSLPYWYEINLYHSETQEFIVAIRKFFQSQNEADQVKSWTFSSLDAAIAHVENYDAAVDVLIPEMDLAAMAPAEMSAMALSLKADVEGVRHHYAGLVGELLMEMESSDASLG